MGSVNARVAASLMQPRAMEFYGMTALLLRRDLEVSFAIYLQGLVKRQAPGSVNAADMTR